MLQIIQGATEEKGDDKLDLESERTENVSNDLFANVTKNERNAEKNPRENTLKVPFS